MSKCRANKPANCRIHGTGYISNQVYKKLHQDWGVSPEEIFVVTSDISEIIDNHSHPSSLLESSRDEKGILEEYYFSQKDLLAAHIPLELIVHEVAFLKDSQNGFDENKNFLNPRVEAPKHEKALVKLLANEGMPVSPHESVLSWEDYEMRKHVKKCGIAYTEKPVEKTWEEFNSTFDDESEYYSTLNDESKHGVECSGECHCGYFKGKLRLQGNLTDLVSKMLHY